MPNCSADNFFKEFTDYQTLFDDDFEDIALEEAKVLEGLKDDNGKKLFH